MLGLESDLDECAIKLSDYVPDETLDELMAMAKAAGDKSGNRFMKSTQVFGSAARGVGAWILYVTPAPSLRLRRLPSATSIRYMARTAIGRRA